MDNFLESLIDICTIDIEAKLTSKKSFMNIKRVYKNGKLVKVYKNGKVIIK